MVDAEGLSLWPEELIAAVTPAFPDRFRVVTADGTVGYLLGPIDPWVQPGYLREGRDPAGFYHGAVEWAPPPEVPVGELCSWGSFDWNQLRRLRREGEGLQATLADGREIRVPPRRVTEVLDRLGLTSLEVMPESLTRVFLREFPFDITSAPAEVLRRYFHRPADLIGNLLWQALEYQRTGVANNFGKSHRGFWYRPLEATLERAGLIDHRATKKGVERIYHDLIARMVGEDRLFCFRDLGFEDKDADGREIGPLHPGVILLIEKDDLAEAGIAAASAFGLSWLVSGGVTRLVTVEFFCDALRAVFAGEARVLVFGDFDPGGRVSGRALVGHLGRFGVSSRGPEFLIEPAVFTAEELHLFSRPLTASDGRVDEFVAETGGINGEARGIHADWLQPPERLIEVVRSLLEAGPAA